jgi:hypothetical protein
MRWTKGTIAVGVGALLLASVLAGGVALAQTPTPTPGSGQTQPGGLRNFFLDQLAKNLNISRSQLDTAAQNAGLATVDEALRLGQIDQDRANRMKEHINQGDGFFGGFGHKMGHGNRGQPQGAPMGVVFRSVADQLRMDPQTLMSELRSGKSLKDIAAGATPPVTDLNTLKPGIKTAVQTELQSKGVNQDRINQVLQRIDGLDLNQLGQRGFGMRVR